jgi:hypothetical protein
MAGNPLWDLLERSSRGEPSGRPRRVQDYLRAAGQDAPSLELLATALAGYASSAPLALADRLCCRDADA